MQVSVISFFMVYLVFVFILFNGYNQPVVFVQDFLRVRRFFVQNLPDDAHGVFEAFALHVVGQCQGGFGTVWQDEAEPDDQGYACCSACPGEAAAADARPDALPDVAAEGFGHGGCRAPVGEDGFARQFPPSVGFAEGAFFVEGGFPVVVACE